MGDTVDAIGIDPTTAAQLGLPFFLRTAGTSPTGQARSRHSGGVQVTLADGSVRFLKNNIVFTIWYFLNSRNDGASFSFE